ncbi:MAG: Gfo/Idh/MocA family oxidoreductase [Armatimonadetes bacterium]|nr:Gfo/Idh/MocA family oxidoreductase [Armatimonadota bacterium]
MLKVGICGFGSLGRAHAANLAQFDNVSLQAICDIELSALKAPLDLAGTSKPLDDSCLAHYTDIRDMLARENLDIVVVATPTDLHARHSVMALDAGCHVFCEKPMALSVEDCESMISARDKNNRQLMIGQCIRFWPEYKYLYDCMRDRRFGEFYSLDMERVGGKWSGWFADPKRSGGALFDLHIHDVDWARMALGKPDDLFAAGRVGGTGGIDNVTAVWQYNNGPVVTIRGSAMNASGFTMSFRAMFEDATVDYRLTDGIHVRRFGKEAEEVIELTHESAYVGEMRYFIESVAGERTNEACSAESSLDGIVLAMAEKAIISKSTERG